MSKKMSTNDFIERAKLIHGDKYIYKKTEYLNWNTKLCVICPKHGEFWQLPSSHLKGCGCKKCGVENMALKHTSCNEDFINKAKIIFGDSYDYSNVKYEKSSKKVKIRCNKCGEIFMMTPNSHLKGEGCPKCTKHGRAKKNIEDFIKEARIIHGSWYDYSKTTYIDCFTKTCITCPKHGEFWQTPANHLRGQGCPICKSSKLENSLALELEKNGIKVLRQYRIDKLGKQSLDFYLPDYNIAIECQGRQHIYPVSFSNKMNPESNLLHIINLDILKNKICKELGIIVLYYMSDEINKINVNDNILYNNKNTFWNLDDLIKEIKGAE